MRPSQLVNTRAGCSRPAGEGCRRSWLISRNGAGRPGDQLGFRRRVRSRSRGVAGPVWASGGGGPCFVDRALLLIAHISEPGTGSFAFAGSDFEKSLLDLRGNVAAAAVADRD